MLGERKTWVQLWTRDFKPASPCVFLVLYMNLSKPAMYSFLLLKTSGTSLRVTGDTNLNLRALRIIYFPELKTYREQKLIEADALDRDNETATTHVMYARFQDRYSQSTDSDS